MPVFVCPICLSSTSQRSAATDDSCASCGHTLTEVKTSEEAGETAADEALVAQLRMAFDSGPRPAGGEPDVFKNLQRQGSGPAVAWQPPGLDPGSVLGDYEIVSELGRGGMGIVYQAYQPALQRYVALKVLVGSAHRGPHAVRRFRTEAQAAARLHHECVVPIYAEGEQDGHLYYAMKLIDGVSLDTAIRSRPELLSSTFRKENASAAPGQSLGKPSRSGATPSSRARPPSKRSGPALPAPAVPSRPEVTLPVSDVTGEHSESTFLDGTWASEPFVRTAEDYRYLARLVAGVAEGLAHAHEQGVIHRDIKPHNLLLGEDSRLHITDFGLAYLTNEPHMTVSGEIMGTPAYLSPEQVRGHIHEIDHRTDIYSLGVTLYELMTRRRPFGGDTRDQILHGICEAEPIRPRQSDPRIPVDLETICLRAMEKDAVGRYPSMRDMAEDLRRFADGRPILSRRAGPIERTFKWARRHKAMTSALVATGCVLILTTALTASVYSSRHERANRLLGDALDTLAHYDYEHPVVVAERVEEAETLGGDPLRHGMVRALMSLGQRDARSAIEYAHMALDAAPDSVDARYLLAWAQKESGDERAWRKTFARAEQIGEPETAKGWFFRAMAQHFALPANAMDAYQQAIAVRRSDEHDAYPQALLHLARAYNEELYQQGATEYIAPAQARFQELIDHGYYEAYPYYLLSITDLLAAEIYSREPGRDGAVAYHYEEALAWARLGQERYPDDARVIISEARCLESMGRLAEAVDARTRAADVAQAGIRKWEAYHYRWRLHYWLNDFDAALSDLETNLDFASAANGHAPFYAKMFYGYVYPALVYAERGDMQQALARVDAMVDAVPGDAQVVIWSSTMLRLFGYGLEADALLAEQADQVSFEVSLTPPQTAEWVQLLYAFCQGAATLDDLEAEASAANPASHLIAEAYFHAGIRALAEGDRAGAENLLQLSYQSFDDERRYTYHAKLILTKLRESVDWPAWLE